MEELTIGLQKYLKISQKDAQMMAQLILENFTTIMFMEKECILGPIIENMKENGKRIKCTEKAHSLGLMVENILENIVKIKRKVTVNSFGQMEDATEVNG